MLITWYACARTLCQIVESGQFHHLTRSRFLKSDTITDMNDDNSQSAPVIETPALVLEPVLTPSVSEPVAEPESAQVEEAPVEPAQTSEPATNSTEAPVSTPVSPEAPPTQSEPVQTNSSQPASSQPASAPLTPQTSQSQLPAQPDQTSFIRTLLAKANEKLHSNRQKKLDTLMRFASTKKKITNDEVQKLLRISDKTAERYLSRLVKEGKLQRFGSTRDVSYGLLL